MIPMYELVRKDLCHWGTLCQSLLRNNKYQVQWIASIIVFEIIFIVLLVYFAISTRAIKKKEFQTQSIIVFVYMLTLTTACSWRSDLLDQRVESLYDFQMICHLH